MANRLVLAVTKRDNESFNINNIVDQVKEQFSLAAEECEKEQEATKVETEVLLQTIHQYQKEEERFETEIKQLENEKEGLEKKLEAENKVLSTKQKELNKLQDTLDKQQKLYEEAKDRHNGPAAALSFGSLGVGGMMIGYNKVNK